MGQKERVIGSGGGRKTEEVTGMEERESKRTSGEKKKVCETENLGEREGSKGRGNGIAALTSFLQVPTCAL